MIKSLRCKTDSRRGCQRSPTQSARLCGNKQRARVHDTRRAPHPLTERRAAAALATCGATDEPCCPGDGDSATDAGVCDSPIDACVADPSGGSELICATARAPPALSYTFFLPSAVLLATRVCYAPASTLCQ